MFTLIGLLLIAGLSTALGILVVLRYRQNAITQRCIMVTHQCIDSIVAHEIDFDGLKSQELALRSEMMVYELNVPKVAFDRYVSMLKDLNRNMYINLGLRTKALDTITENDVKLTKTQYRVNRCKMREDRDRIRCEYVREFLDRLMSAKTKTHFKGIRSLSNELKLMDRVTTDPITN